jgi:hypothetical protein
MQVSKHGLIVVSWNHNPLAMCILPTKIDKVTPFVVGLIVEKIAEEEDFTGLVLNNQGAESIEVFAKHSMWNRNTCFSEVGGFSEVGVGNQQASARLNPCSTLRQQCKRFCGPRKLNVNTASHSAKVRLRWYICSMKNWGILCLVVLVMACRGDRKQRDVRKLSWFETHADARNSVVDFRVPASELERRKEAFSLLADSLKKKHLIEIRWIGYTPGSLRDTLAAETRASLVEIRGNELELGVSSGWLMGPFDRLIPASKKYPTDKESWRISDGVASSGFAVPCVICEADTLGQVPFLAIPVKGKSQAGAMVLLDYMLEAGKKQLETKAQ